MEEQTHVVIAFPHPDDECFGTAGSIYNFRKKDIPVTYLCGTLGEMGRNMGTPPFANRETLPHVREQELKDACEFLDIDYQLLGYRDKTMEFENKDKMAQHIKSILEEIEPSLVITFYPEHGVHPDHNAIGEATIEAVRLMDKESRPTVWASAITKDFEKELGEPDIVVDVRDNFEYKLQSILKHKSQAEGMLKKIEEDEDALTEFVSGLKERLGKERFFIWQFD